jgi:hypothetical protein
MDGARPFAVIGGRPGAPRAAYLKRDAAAAAAAIPLPPGVDATDVFRLGARCETSRCTHYSGGVCGLGERIARQLDPVVDVPPPCTLRPDCRWHAEQGVAACLRCPQVITRVPPELSRLRAAAVPQISAPSAPLR